MNPPARSGRLFSVLSIVILNHIRPRVSAFWAARIRQNQDLQDWRDFQDFIFARISLFDIAGNPAKVDLMSGLADCAFCQNQDLQDWRDLQDFTIARIALFAIAGNPAKADMDERLPVKDAPIES